MHDRNQELGIVKELDRWGQRRHYSTPLPHSVQASMTTNDVQFIPVFGPKMAR
jgi:hypothetical protein